MANLSLLAIMPCLGRHQITVEAVVRMKATAGTQNFGMVCVVQDDIDLALLLEPHCTVLYSKEKLTYWQALQRASIRWPADLFVNLANDLLPGTMWLQRALGDYLREFHNRGRHGVVGFNDGFTDGSRAAHFIISKTLLQTWFGNSLWPVMYNHNFGDTEIVNRAKRMGQFVFSSTAVLYHNHPVNGAPFDDVYKIGMSKWNSDQAVYNSRTRLWE